MGWAEGPCETRRGATKGLTRPLARAARRLLEEQRMLRMQVPGS